MKIFKELKKLGYKHYAECTIEELDDLPLNSEERIMEQALVLRWFREKYKLRSTIIPYWIGDTYMTVIEGKMIGEIKPKQYKTYEEAELECLKKLIEIVKNRL